MFRPVRKKKNEIGVEAAQTLLLSERRGVLAVQGDDGYPYAVPINYFYDIENQRILFHGSPAGHKADAIKRCDKVCFTVFGNETAKPEEAWAPYLQSAVVFGRCHRIEDRKTVLETCRRFAMKYYPNEKTVDEELAVSGNAVSMYVIDIEHISGKQVQEK